MTRRVRTSSSWNRPAWASWMQRARLAGNHPISDPASTSDVEHALDALTLAISRDFAYAAQDG